MTIATAEAAAASDPWAFLDALSEGVYGIDASGACLFVNAAALRALGYDQVEVIGRNMHELIHHTRPDGSPYPKADCPLLRTAQAGDPVRLEREMLWRRDGTAFLADYSSFPMPATSGIPGGIVTFTQTMPVTTDTGANPGALMGTLAGEASQDAALSRFRTMVDGIPQLGWIADAEGSITWYNRRWYDYTGTDFAAMAGWGWRSVHHPDHIERVERRVRHCFENGELWEDTFPLRAADGSYGWFLSRAMPIRDEPDARHPEGRVLGWFGTNTDITAIREAEQKMEAARDEAETANRAKSTFIANMSHELRTPLSAIIGYAEMLAEEIEDGQAPSDLAHDIEKIEGNARHLLGLINDVLDLSKVESGKMEAFAETFDIATMASDVRATVGALIEKKGNRLDIELGDGLDSMHSDVTRIRQILLNLLGNAAKFTEEGVITLAISREPGRDGVDLIRFRVADTGIGMSEEQLAKLFQRFQQADASTTRQFGGTGLGLALTKAFAAMLGGTIDVRSRVGHGSTFDVVLPAVLRETQQTGASTFDHDAPDLDDRDVVLVVDDDETQRDLTSRFLAREGYAARTAADGPTGLALARRLKPRAILLDVTMPGMDGWSVLSALKADPELAGIPVVMVTFASERALASSLGAADYVVKPVDWNRLRHVMEAFRDADGDVLVVDDEAESRQRSRHALERNGWSVVEAANGRDGLDQVARAMPRVILLDLNMPVMDGFEFLQALRARPGCAAIPVVVLTALDLTAEDRRRLRGANQVLNKGTTPMRDLVEKLRQLGSGQVAHTALTP